MRGSHKRRIRRYMQVFNTRGGVISLFFFTIKTGKERGTGSKVLHRQKKEK